MPIYNYYQLTQDNSNKTTDRTLSSANNTHQNRMNGHPDYNYRGNMLLSEKIKSINSLPSSERKKFIPYDIIGKTISPKIAALFENEINFTDTGSILSFKTHIISTDRINLLLNNEIPPLNKTPQLTDNYIRTPGEVIINLASLIEKYRLPNSIRLEIENNLKDIWLEGVSHKQDFNKIANRIIKQTGNDQRLLNELNNIINTLERKKFITKRNDNYYGRLFETTLSKYIINHPNTNMMCVKDAISTFIIKTFNQLSWDNKIKACTDIADKMYLDPPLWRYNIDSANEFIKNDTPDNFIKMVNYSGQYSIPLLLSIAVKYLTTQRKNGIVSDIRKKATTHYYKIIKPQRRILPSSDLNRQLTNSRYGILLPYQTPVSSNKVEFGIRPIDKYVRPTNNITPHDRIALSHERAVGIGMSGSANLLNTLFNSLKNKNKDFPIDNAKLAAASWLTYSGGHSYNEAYTVFNSAYQKRFQPLSFNSIKQINQLSEKAVNYAYDYVIKSSINLNNK